MTQFEFLGESISNRITGNVKAVEESFKEHFKNIEEIKKNLLLQQNKFRLFLPVGQQVPKLTAWLLK